MNIHLATRSNRSFCGHFALLSVLVSSAAHSQPKAAPTFAQINGSHDIALSYWGPYSKKYAGISHIPKLNDGFRFDVTLVPGFYRSKSVVPNVLFESGYVPWEVDSQMMQFTYRYQLEWRDQVVVDCTYTIVDEATVLVKVRCVNNTALPQNLALNLLANMVALSVVPNTQIQTSAPTFWVNAADYKSLETTKKGPSYTLVYDGQLRGEVRGNEFIDGKAVGRGFGADASDSVVYDLKINESQRRGQIRLLTA